MRVSGVRRTTRLFVTPLVVLTAVSVAFTASTPAPFAAAAGAVPVIVGGRQPQAPAISGDRVVWSDYRYGTYDIYLYDASDGTTTRLTATAFDEIEPDIDGDTVVYSGYGPQGADIYAYDIPSGTTRAVTATPGDQRVPRISGAHVVWEDRFPSYTAQIWGIDLDGGTAFKIDSGYGVGKRAPRVSGDVVVYEDYPRGIAADSDVVAVTFPPDQFANAMGVKVRLAGTTAPEMTPDVDGPHVVWADGSGQDLDIKRHDLDSGQTFVVCGEPGEQSSPVIDGTTVYWAENGAAGRLHTRTFDIASGGYAVFDSFSSNEPAALAVGGGGVVWLEGLRDAWRVRALPGTAQGVESRGTGLTTWLLNASSRLITAFAGNDTTPPRIDKTSVKAGAVRVSPKVKIVVTASEPLDSRSVSAHTITLVDATGTKVPIRISYAARSRSITVAPRTPLGSGTYALKIGPGLKDRRGNSSTQETFLNFSTVSALADIAAPTVPDDPLARVSGTSAVEVTWQASTDDVGVVRYEVYRHTVPMSATVPGTLVANVAAPQTAVTTATAAGETAGKYTLYYAVKAFDAEGNSSAVSANVSPDPHGTNVSGQNVRNCMLCHERAPHGVGSSPAEWRALGAQSKDACYLCHGDTSDAVSYGYGSTMNTEGRFWDYSDDGGTALPAGGSRHRNVYMDGEQLQCSSCHAAHKKPYDVDPTKSYARMLRRYDPLGYWIYWRSDGAVVKSNGTTVTATFDEALCLSCHGAATAEMARVGGPTAYAASAGDHSAGYDTAATAHGPSTVRDDPTKPATDGPQVPCAACHNKHASASASLIDYRTSNTRTSEYDQAGICFECHVDSYVSEYNAGVDWTSNSANAYFSWNGRNLRSEFSRASHHPYNASDGLTCYSCHNTHNVTKGAFPTQVWQAGRVSDPDNIKTVWAGTITNFCLRCHDAAAPTKHVNDANTLRPYDVVFGSVTAPLFPGWNKSGYSASGHGASRVNNMSPGCETCHDPHGSDNQRLTALTAYNEAQVGHMQVKRNNSSTYAEERLCLVCHRSATAGCTGVSCHPDLANPDAANNVVLDVQTPFAATYSHDIDNAAWEGRHTDTETASGLGSANRHVECADCHDAHLTVAGRHVQGSSAAGAVLTGAWGVKPTAWPAAGGTVASGDYVAERMSGEATDYEAYVCLKCHSSYSTRGTTSGGFASTDVASEFNPNNASGHNVFGSVWTRDFTKGAATWAAAPTLSFVGGSGWTSTSAMTCSDCHSYNAAGASGPHGSSVRYMLKYGSGTDDWWATDIDDWNTDPGNMCAACHQQSHASWLGGRVDHRTTCETCHVRIPHGWKRPRLLVYHGAAGDAAPYRGAATTGLIGVDLISITDTMAKGDCQTNCGSHSNTPAAEQW